MALIQKVDVRMAEVIASLSLATDLGMGQPMEQALRTCLIALGLARRTGCEAEPLRDVYYLALVEHIGCTADAYETSLYTGGDDIAFRAHSSTIPASPPSEILPYMLRHFAADRPAPERVRLFVSMMANGSRRFPAMTAARCEVATRLANRIGLSPGVQLGVTQMVERWDGKGGPAGLKGEAISLPARIVQLAHDVEIFERLGGVEAATGAVRKRLGHGFDPSVGNLYITEGAEVMAEIPADSVWEAVLAGEPEPRMTVSPGRLDDISAALADFVDLKSPYLHGHSTGTSRLASGAAERMHLDPQDGALLRRAALLHDLGRIGVANGIWQKPGPLTPAEFEHVRLHPYYTERILSRSVALAPVASVASAHHERLDRSGYHRGSTAAQLPPPARILAAADAYQALTQDRPHRHAFAPDGATAELRKEVDAGRLDRAAVDAVLDAAGQRRLGGRQVFPAGLSEREVEVLRLVAQGKSNREMARTLSIAEKTVGHHVEHIYNKIGRSTRAGAALFAMEHDLV